MKRITLLIVALVLLLSTLGCAKVTSGEDVIEAFKDAGLDVGVSRKMREIDYGFAPVVCEGTLFYITSLGVINGGHIYICETPEDMEKLVTYYTDLSKKSSALHTWVYTKDNIVLQLNGELPEDKAKQFEAALP